MNFKAPLNALKASDKLYLKQHDAYALVSNTHFLVKVRPYEAESLCLKLEIKPATVVRARRKGKTWEVESGDPPELNTLLESCERALSTQNRYNDTGLMSTKEKECIRIYDSGSDFAFIDTRYLAIFDNPPEIFGTTPTSSFTVTNNNADVAGVLLPIRIPELPSVLQELFEKRNNMGKRLGA